MLSLEYLLEEAKNNGLPLLKKRAIIREYLQVIILNSIYSHRLGKRVYFTGGTSLRYFYDMPRFSEDLDFDTDDLTHEDFKELLKSAEKGLMKEGFSVNISPEKRKDLFIAELNFEGLMKIYGLTDTRTSDLMIKIEIYKPSWRLTSQPDVLSLYGYNFSAVLLGKGNVISEKLCALFNRRRGRDIYDLLFMLKRCFPFDEEVLKANMIKGSPKKLILEYLNKLPEKELLSMANQFRPFLFKEDDIELVLKAPTYAERFLREHYQ